MKITRFDEADLPYSFLSKVWSSSSSPSVPSDVLSPVFLDGRIGVAYYGPDAQFAGPPSRNRAFCDFLSTPVSPLFCYGFFSFTALFFPFRRCRRNFQLSPALSFGIVVPKHNSQMESYYSHPALGGPYDLPILFFNVPFALCVVL